MIGALTSDSIGLCCLEIIIHNNSLFAKFGLWNVSPFLFIIIFFFPRSRHYLALLKKVSLLSSKIKI